MSVSLDRSIITTMTLNHIHVKFIIIWQIIFIWQSFLDPKMFHIYLEITKQKLHFLTFETKSPWLSHCFVFFHSSRNRKIKHILLGQFGLKGSTRFLWRNHFFGKTFEPVPMDRWSRADEWGAAGSAERRQQRARPAADASGRAQPGLLRRRPGMRGQCKRNDLQNLCVSSTMRACVAFWVKNRPSLLALSCRAQECSPPFVVRPPPLSPICVWHTSGSWILSKWEETPCGPTSTLLRCSCRRFQPKRTGSDQFIPLPDEFGTFRSWAQLSGLNYTWWRILSFNFTGEQNRRKVQDNDVRTSVLSRSRQNSFQPQRLQRLILECTLWTKQKSRELSARQRYNLEKTLTTNLCAMIFTCLLSHSDTDLWQFKNKNVLFYSLKITTVSFM